MLESKIGHDPVVTSSQENVMKCTTPEYPCKLHKRNLSLEFKFRIHLCILLVWNFCQRYTFWYQKMIFWYQKISTNFWYQKSISHIRKSFSDVRKWTRFLYQKFVYFFYIRNSIFWYQKYFFDIRNYFLISEIPIFWYQKIISDSRK